MHDEQATTLDETQNVAPFFVIESLNKTGPLGISEHREGRLMAEGKRQYCFTVFRSISGFCPLVALYDGAHGDFRDDLPQFKEHQLTIVELNRRVGQAIHFKDLPKVKLAMITKVPGYIEKTDLDPANALVTADPLDLVPFSRDTFSYRPHTPRFLDDIDNAVVIAANDMREGEFNETIIKPLIKAGILPEEVSEWLKPIPYNAGS